MIVIPVVLFLVTTVIVSEFYFYTNVILEM